jgi:hypothetical protein
MSTSDIQITPLYPSITIFTNLTRMPVSEDIRPHTEEIETKGFTTLWQIADGLSNSSDQHIRAIVKGNLVFLTPKSFFTS